MSGSNLMGKSRFGVNSNFDEKGRIKCSSLSYVLNAWFQITGLVDCGSRKPKLCFAVQSNDILHEMSPESIRSNHEANAANAAKVADTWFYHIKRIEPENLDIHRRAYNVIKKRCFTRPTRLSKKYRQLSVIANFKERVSVKRFKMPFSAAFG
jgi:hypothetical protein